MRRNTELLKIEVKVIDNTCLAVIDTGTECSIISSPLASDSKLNITNRVNTFSDWLDKC